LEDLKPDVPIENPKGNIFFYLLFKCLLIKFSLERMTGVQLLKLMYEERSRIKARKKQRSINEAFANKI